MPGDLYLQACQAHLLALSGNLPQAREIYLKHAGQMVIEIKGRKTWNALIREMFVEMESVRKGLPLFEEMKAALKEPEAVKQEVKK